MKKNNFKKRTETATATDTVLQETLSPTATASSVIATATESSLSTGTEMTTRNISSTRVTTLATANITTISTTQPLAETATSAISESLQRRSSSTARTLERATSTGRDIATVTATTYDDDASFPVIDLTNNSDDSVSDIRNIFDRNITLSSDEDLFNFSQNEEEEEEEQNLEVLKSSKNQNYVQEEK